MENTKPISEKLIQKMINKAKESRKNAFPYRSMHKIWASILTTKWIVIWWCNIESTITWLWTCAERCAIDNAITNWEYDIIAVCTVDSKFTPTCGACLQYILQFSQILEREIRIINADIRGHYKISTLSELLPQWYKTWASLNKIRSYIAKHLKKNNK